MFSTAAIGGSRRASRNVEWDDCTLPLRCLMQSDSQAVGCHSERCFFILLGLPTPDGGGLVSVTHSKFQKGDCLQVFTCCGRKLVENVVFNTIFNVKIIGSS